LLPPGVRYLVQNARNSISVGVQIGYCKWNTNLLAWRIRSNFDWFARV